MKSSHAILAIAFIASAAARAQVVPSVNGPLPIPGRVDYELRYTQSARFGAGNDNQSSFASGELSYANLNNSRPFSAMYSGGDGWYYNGAHSTSGIFQHLMVSQGILRRNWTLTLGDNVSYLPQAASTGFSGIPGVGSLPSVPGEPSQPILTQNTRSIDNIFSPRLSYRLDHATGLGVDFSYGILRFPDANGLETNSLRVGPQINRRLNALNSISGQYFYSRFSYPDYPYVLGTESALFGYQRTWSRRLTTGVSAGPEWVLGSDTLNIPSSTGLAVRANANYKAGLTSVGVGYFQAASGGGGVSTAIGVRNHDLYLQIARPFGQILMLSCTGGYMRTQGLTSPGATDGEYGECSATHRLGQHINLFASYSIIDQSSSSALPANAINGMSQGITFGIGYSPREMHFK